MSPHPEHMGNIVPLTLGIDCGIGGIHTDDLLTVISLYLALFIPSGITETGPFLIFMFNYGPQIDFNSAHGFKFTLWAGLQKNCCPTASPQAVYMSTRCKQQTQ